jgi:hypothetical protein
VYIIVNPLRILLNKIYSKAAGVLDCSVCASFWTSLLTDLVVRFYFHSSYFMWPISGVIVCGLTWTVYELLNSIDKNKETEEGI